MFKGSRSNLANSFIGHLLVHRDVEVIAALITQEQADRDARVGVRKAYCHLDLGLEDPEFPNATAVSHHHAADGLFQLHHRQITPNSSGYGYGSPYRNFAMLINR